MNTEQRLAALELDLKCASQKYRRLLLAVAACSALAIAWALHPSPSLAQSTGESVKELRAKRFVLEDDDGNTRGELAMLKGVGPLIRLMDAAGSVRLSAGLTADGDPILCMYDQSKEPRVALDVAEDNPTLRLFDRRGEARVRLLVLEDGSPVFGLSDESTIRLYVDVKEQGPRLWMFDEKGVDGLGLSVRNDHSPNVTLFDAEEQGRLHMLVDKHGRPSLEMLDDSGKGRIMIGLGEAGAPTIALFDEAEKTRIELGVSLDGGPAVQVMDKDGETRARLGANRVGTEDGKSITFPESTLLLFGPDGRLLWRSP